MNKNKDKNFIAKHKVVNIKKACSSFIKIEFLKAKLNYSSAFFLCENV